MMTVFLSKPAMVSALGVGLEQHLARLFSGDTATLSLQSQWIDGESRYFGAVNLPLRDFPDDLPAAYHSRNNQLLWHALADLEPDIMAAIERYGRERVAVVMGTSTTGVDENIHVFQAVADGMAWDDLVFKQEQQVMSAPADFVQYQYGLRNACYGVSTACTSGARALISAARLLKLGICDAVICGGVDTLSPLTINGFHSLEVLSKGIANPFSSCRDGINIGEAAAAFVLSRERDADGIALLGYGSSSDAYHMSSPRPDGLGAIQAFEQALQHANCVAQDIGWINLHGTGTQHNDSMESRAVAQVFGLNTPCTSTKPLTGHTLGAAGALEAALLWGVLSRQYNADGKLPAQIWDKQQDDELPHIALSNEHAYWQTAKRVGASSSFAFGGNNSVLILGEA